MAKEKKMYKLERYCYKFGGNFFFFTIEYEELIII